MKAIAATVISLLLFQPKNLVSNPLFLRRLDIDTVCMNECSLHFSMKDVNSSSFKIVKLILFPFDYK